MPKLATQMNPDEIVIEIRRLHAGIEQSALRLGELSRLLLVRSRPVAARTASETTKRIASANVVYANAWARLGGLVAQAVRRTKVADRTLDNEQRDVADAIRDAQHMARQAEANEARAAITARQAHRSTVATPVIGDLMELYGKEIVDDAVAR